MSELVLVLLYAVLGTNFRASCEERELRKLTDQHQWNLIQYESGGPVGILALHGFGVCPQLFNRWLPRWRTQGWSYRIPMLTGSVESLYEFENSKWKNWERRAIEAYDELADKCDQVVVVGFSNGGLAAVRVAQLRRPKSIVLLAPFFSLATSLGPLGEWLLSKMDNCPPRIFIPNKSLDCSNQKGVKNLFRFRHTPLRAVIELLKFRDTVINGGKINCPVFWSHSRKDHVASYTASLEAISSLSSDVNRVVLNDSFHYIMHDVESEFLEDKVIDFISRQIKLV